MDETPAVTEFADTLERVCVETVESGKMTKDLALLIGPGQEFQSTEEFLGSVEQRLAQAMSQERSPGRRPDEHRSSDLQLKGSPSE
ncbi:hypothetical protein BH20ACT19_BH20ACT19_06370 [soil metagenome]